MTTYISECAPLKVIMGKTKILNEQYYSLDQVSSHVSPKIAFDLEEGKYYTICMIDTKIPIINNYGKTEWLHWLIINCDSLNKDIIMQYSPPTPSADSGVHDYYICVFEQSNKIKLSKLKDNKTNRLNFDVEYFISENGLKCVGSVMFKTSA